MALDPRTPVVVGVGQVNQRVEPDDAEEPVALMAEAARLAATDAGVDGLASRAESVRVVAQLSRRYLDPGVLVAERVGADPRQSLVTTMGGNTPQALLNATAQEIQRGRLDVALLCGAEAWRSRVGLRQGGRSPGWTVQAEDTPPAGVIGTELNMSAPAETAQGIIMPVQVYPLFENALRAAAGRSVEEHRAHLGRLWAGFSEVAAANPAAWSRQSFTATEIATAGPENRMIGFPYTKRMNSNNAVDQGAALVLCSVGAARRFGVAEDRWVFPHSGVEAMDHAFVSDRADLVSSPAIRLAGAAALGLAGVGADDLAQVDLYSCFPSAVQVAAHELGLGLGRPLTVTGGMSFAGGPWNNFAMHAIAAMVGRLRDEPGSFGLCTANGGFLTKHALGVYSTTPPATGFRWAEPQREVDALPRRRAAEGHVGPATLESYTVMYERDGSPANGLAASLTAGGERAWATTAEPAVMAAMASEELVGRPVTLAEGGELHLG